MNNIVDKYWEQYIVDMLDILYNSGDNFYKDLDKLSEDELDTLKEDIKNNLLNDNDLWTTIDNVFTYYLDKYIYKLNNNK